MFRYIYDIEIERKVKISGGVNKATCGNPSLGWQKQPEVALNSPWTFKTAPPKNSKGEFEIAGIIKPFPVFFLPLAPLNNKIDIKICRFGLSG